MILTGWSMLCEQDGPTLVERVALPLPCLHTVLIKPDWLDDSGAFSGRLGCTFMGCRKIFEDVVLENWIPR